MICPVSHISPFIVIFILFKAIGFYWCTTNVISVTQAKLIRIESLRRILGIPKFIKWDEKKLPVKEKGVKEAFRESK